MKVSRLLTAGTVGIGLLATIFLVDVDTDTISTKTGEKLGYTPEQLKKQYFEKKKQKREAGYAKSNKPDEYMKYHMAIRTRDGEDKPGYSLNYKLKELAKGKTRAQAMRLANAVEVSEWKWRGPYNVPGRTRGMIVDPADATGNTWFAGSVAGGVWKTTDAGQTWELKTPDLPNLATSTLAYSPANPDKIYAGTGEGFYNLDAVAGDGMFVSEDHGETWSQIASTAGNDKFVHVNRIIVDPSDANTLLVCVDGRGGSYILKSTDGGASWMEVYSSFNRIQQLVADPTDFNTQYAAVYGTGVLKTDNAGNTWTMSSSGLSASGRIELAIAPTDANRIYASVEGTSTASHTGNSELSSDLFVSADAGASWELVNPTNSAEDFLGGQGWYDNTIAVHPYNEDIVYYGGVNLWKTEVTDEVTTSDRTILGVSSTNTDNFMVFVNFGQDYFGGAMALGEDVTSAQLRNVEIRFGQGTQMAHRFTIKPGSGTDGDGGAGVAAGDYLYQDYVEVPFQVWDTENNQQLMVSFRDQEGDGKYDLETRVESDPTIGREYLYVHRIAYDETQPNAAIAANGGQEESQLYFFWPALAEGATWDDQNLPLATIEVEVGNKVIRTGSTINISDAYSSYSGNNNRYSYHPDQHNLIMIKDDEAAKTFRILAANDGGVYISKSLTNPGEEDKDFIFAGNGYITSQFYGADKKPGANEYIGGMQDNGTYRSASGEDASETTEYAIQIYGDGFDAIWHSTDPNKLIGGSQYNNFARSLNGGETWIPAKNGLGATGSGNGPFISKLANNRSNPDVLYTVGATGVWKSSDFGGNWTGTTITDGWFFGSFTDVRISEANVNVVWAGGAMDSDSDIFVSTDAGETFTAVADYSSPMGRISGLGTHPADDQTAYVLFSYAGAPKILRTTDQGASWEDITGFSGSNGESTNGFPDVAVYSILVMPQNNDIIWVGTEIGIVESTDNGATWHLLQGDLPSVSVWDMRIADDQIVISTHGLGIWTATIPSIPATVYVPSINGIGISPDGEFVVNAMTFSDFDSTYLYMDGEKAASTEAVSANSELIYKLTNVGTAEVSLQMIGYNAGKAYPSSTKSATPLALSETVESYTTDFETVESGDLDQGSYQIKRASGFSDKAIHTPHKYATNKEYVMHLLKPVVIAQEDAFISYKDIAIVEPAEEGAEYGDMEFWDYVVIEGTLDGVNWLPIAPGYDAGAYADWTSIYKSGASATKAAFKEHEVNLHDTFEPGDKVLFRFRLHSDAGETGWGWVIDDLNIQGEMVDEQEILDASTALDTDVSVTTYPNPVTEKATFKYALSKASEVNLRVYNLEGKLVHKADLGKVNAGENTYEWNASDVKSGVYFIEMNSAMGKRTSKFVVQ